MKINKSEAFLRRVTVWSDGEMILEAADSEETRLRET